MTFIEPKPGTSPGFHIVVADVTLPLIGVDFLSHFGLLVDCRNNRASNSTFYRAMLRVRKVTLKQTKIS
jgi:hypothetical protein